MRWLPSLHTGDSRAWPVPHHVQTQTESAASLRRGLRQKRLGSAFSVREKEELKVPWVPHGEEGSSQSPGKHSFVLGVNVWVPKLMKTGDCVVTGVGTHSSAEAVLSLSEACML